MVIILTYGVANRIKGVKRDFNLIHNVQLLKFTIKIYLCISRDISGNDIFE